MNRYRNIRICYLPNDITLKAPGDRRRFVYYAKQKKINFDTKIKKKQYQLIYITYGSNLFKIGQYLKKNPQTKLIFEMVDANLSQGKWINFLKGFGRFLLGKESKIYLDYREPLKKIIRRCHAVVCSSESQLKIIKKLNNNSFVLLDFFENEIKQKKKVWLLSKKKTIRLFWEGMIYNLKHLLIFNEIYKYLDFNIHIVIVTDLKKSLFLGLINFDSKKISKNFKFSFEIHEWRKVEIYKIAMKCDIGIIPIDLDNIYSSYKPENKLVFMWKLGLPVVTSSTQAYKKTMKLAKINMYAKDAVDWIKVLNNFYKFNHKKRLDYKKKVEILIKKNYSKQKLIDDWSNIFKSVGFKF